MKYPHQINSAYFELLLPAGWMKERNVLLEKLPNHLEELPNDVKIFLRVLWFISFAKKIYSLNQYDDYYFNTSLYTFGETMFKLTDYSISDEYNELYTSLVNCKIRNFGHCDQRELLIDEYGRLYILPDSGDLYIFEGKFYQALYHLIFRPRKAYLIGDNFELFNDANHILEKTGLYLDDLK